MGDYYPDVQAAFLAGYAAACPATSKAETTSEIKFHKNTAEIITLEDGSTAVRTTIVTTLGKPYWQLLMGRLLSSGAWTEGKLSELNEAALEREAKADAEHLKCQRIRKNLIQNETAILNPQSAPSE